MDGPPGLRGPLFTDLYELVMAQTYLRTGLADRRARFDYFYRSNPDYGTHQAGFGVTAGLGPFLGWLEAFRFTSVERERLTDIRNASGRRVFDAAFLDWLVGGDHVSELEVSAVDEGRVVHPHLPVVSVVGPLAAAQLVETALLNHLNYASLIATKAARIVRSALGSPTLEFGMRRGPGAGVDEGARAALIGGCDATSNVEASVAAGVDPQGTHAHSFVQAFMAVGGGELEAFRAFAADHPDGCVLLVDTIDTLGSGLPNAITVFGELRDAGHRPGGVRLDSGDLAYLGVRAARMLDDAGFDDARIVLSGDLDELTIWQILTQMADEAAREGVDIAALRARLVYGVGTRLITSEGDGAFDGVYKLVGICDEDGAWVPAVKISENPAKIPIPGPKAVWRLYDRRGTASVDVVTADDGDPLDADTVRLHHPYLDGVSRTLPRDAVSRAEPLHRTVFSDGAPTTAPPPVAELRDRCRADIERLDPGVVRLVNPHRYHVSLDDTMKARQRHAVERARSGIRAT